MKLWISGEIDENVSVFHRETRQFIEKELNEKLENINFYNNY